VWKDFLAAVALVLIIEGVAPFLNPGGLRHALQQIANMPDRTLRAVGFSCMIVGALLLYFVRH